MGIDAGDGSDVITVDPTVTRNLRIEGGAGNDILTGGNNNGTAGHHLVLLGTSSAHLRFLTGLNQHPLPGVTVTLVATHTRHVHAQQLADIVAGQATLEHSSVALDEFTKVEIVG